MEDIVLELTDTQDFTDKAVVGTLSAIAAAASAVLIRRAYMTVVTAHRLKKLAAGEQ